MQAAPAAAVQALPDFTIVEANKAAVVNVTSTVKAAQAKGEEDAGANPLEGLDEDNPLYEFFRRWGQIPQMPRGPRQGLGSGFIVEPSGVVLTNAHVVEGADEVRVRLSDRREFKGKVLGVDKPSDIAVVKIEASGLPVREARRSLEAARGRLGARDRLALRLRQLRHRRHRERHLALAARRHVRALHPDRRRGEPGHRAGRCSTCAAR